MFFHLSVPQLLEEGEDVVPPAAEAKEGESKMDVSGTPRPVPPLPPVPCLYRTCYRMKELNFDGKRYVTSYTPLSIHCPCPLHNPVCIYIFLTYSIICTSPR